MTKPRTLVGAALLAGAVILGATGCSQPDPNPPVVITGDPNKANPPVESTTTTTSTIPPTTLYYAQK
jgi:hypothetical protein